MPGVSYAGAAAAAAAAPAGVEGEMRDGLGKFRRRCTGTEGKQDKSTNVFGLVAGY